MDTNTFNKLEKALMNADKAARQFAESEDFGTCNFDTPVIRIKATEKQMSSLDYKVIKVGEKGWKDCWFIFIPLMGQANRRTRMAEAAARSLIADGFEAGVYYQMD